MSFMTVTVHQIIITIIATKMIHEACNMHIVKKKGIERFHREHEQTEPLWILVRVMRKSVFERNRMGGLDCFYAHDKCSSVNCNLQQSIQTNLLLY